MAGDARFTATEADYIEANRLCYATSSHRRWLVWATIAVAVFGCGDVVFAVSNGRPTSEALLDAGWSLVATIALIAARLLVPVQTRRNVRRMLAQNTSLRAEVACEWDDRAVTFSGANGNAHLAWSELHRWLHDYQSFVSLPSDRMMLVLPVRVLTFEQGDDLLATARTFGPQPA